jgi:uncharacterized protein (TIGR02246 family)
MRLRPWMFATLSVLLAAACAPKNDSAAAQDTTASAPGASAKGSADPQVEETALRATHERFKAAVQARNADSAATFYAPNAVVVSDSGRVLEGRAAIRRDFANQQKQLPAGTQFTADISALKVSRSGDVAYQTGTFRFTVSGQPPVEGYYLVALEKLDGQWKVVREADILKIPNGAPARR